MKKLIAMSAIAALCMSSLSACGSAKKTGTESKGTDGVKKVGILQLVEHDALDAACKGFKEGLEELGYKDGEKIEIVFKNAQGEQSNCQTISSQLVSDQCDLILAIGTPAAQAAANETKDIPILVTAVTDPESAKLVNSNKAPGTNVSGTSDLTPVKEQMELLTKIFPNAKKVGLLYCSAESNSEFQIGIAKEQAKALGLETVDASVSESSEIRQVVESLKGKVDAIYTPTDNLIAAGMATVAMVANEAGIPIIVGEEGMCKAGGLATKGINYYELGKQTAKQAAKILSGEAKVSEMPIEYLEKTDLIINEDTVKSLGITIPEDIASKATMIKTEVK